MIKHRVFSSCLPKISDIILGAAPFGAFYMDDATASAELDCYLDMGGNCVDTARVYSQWLSPELEGASERFIGRYIKERACRDRIIISTKCCHPNCSTMDVPRLSKADLLGDTEKSLRDLNVDCIDIMWLHRDSQAANIEMLCETLNILIREGKIRCFGASNWTPMRVREFNAFAQANGLEGFSGVQIKMSMAYTPMTDKDDNTLVFYDDYAQEFDSLGLPVFAYTSQASGYFSKPIGSKPWLDCEENIRRHKMVDAYCAEHGVSPAKVGLQYLTRYEGLSVFPIIGCSSVAQLKDCLS